jgi:hypothetical protein
MLWASPLYSLCIHSFPHTCWLRQVLTLAINIVAQKEETDRKSCEDFIGARRTQPLVDCLWCFVVFVSRTKRKSLIIFLFHTWYCSCIHFYVTICMKLDLGMHIVMQLVFFGKAGVTPHKVSSPLHTKSEGRWRLPVSHLGPKASGEPCTTWSTQESLHKVGTTLHPLSSKLSLTLSTYTKHMQVYGWAIKHLDGLDMIF